MTCLASFVRGCLEPRHRVERPSPPVMSLDSSDSSPSGDLKADVRAALGYLDPNPYDSWIATGQRLRPLPFGKELWLEWSAQYPAFDRREAEAKWATFTADRTGYAAIFAEAQRNGWINPANGCSSSVPILPAVREFSARFAARFRAGGMVLPASPWVSAGDLRYKHFEPVSWVVPGIIPQGAIILGGRPKLGKSWLALDTAIAVAEGGFTFGIACEAGDVLYAALEDTERRLKSRMWKLKGEAPWPKRLNFMCELPRADEGGVELVRKWIEQADDPRLIIIDTLARVRPGKGRDEGSYDADYRAVTSWKALADEYNIAVVLVHHVRKLVAEDPLEMISGTNGLTGAADAILILNRTSQGCSLGGRGRDLEEFERAISFNPQACRWTVLGNAADIQRSSERNAILGLLSQSTEPLSPKQISHNLRMNDDAIRQMLLRMVEAGELIKMGRGAYATPYHNSHNVTADHAYDNARCGDISGYET